VTVSDEHWTYTNAQISDRLLLSKSETNQMTDISEKLMASSCPTAAAPIDSYRRTDENTKYALKRFLRFRPQ